MTETPPPPHDEFDIELNIDDQTLRIGADGELIPIDELGYPVKLAGVSHEQEAEVRTFYSMLKVMGGLLGIAFLLIICVGALSLTTPKPINMTADHTATRRAIASTSDAVFATIDARMTEQAAAAAATLTAQPSLVFGASQTRVAEGFAAISPCRGWSLPFRLNEGVIIMQVELFYTDERYILLEAADGSLVCKVIAEPVADEVVRFEHYQRGAIFSAQADDSQYHARFVSGELVVSPSIPESALADFIDWNFRNGMAEIRHTNEEWWIFPVIGISHPIRKPIGVRDILWAEWVSD